jgi:peptidoglycan/LPS O-acetylase OafA/YrhL
MSAVAERPPVVDAPPVTGRYAHIDALRALAVMLVVISHAGLGAVVPGGSGVTIFFTISGFVITHLMLRERDATGRFALGAFYARRALKLGPPYLVVVLAPTIVYALVHGVNGGQVAAQLLFSYNWVAAHLGAAQPDVLPGSGVTWSLAIEEQFYVVIALLWVVLAARAKDPVRALVAVAVVVLVASNAARVLLAQDAAHTWRIFYGTDTRMDALAVGMLAAVAHRAGVVPRALGSPATVALAALAYLATLAFRDPLFRDTARYLIQSAATCAVILWGLQPRAAAATPLTRLIGARAIQVIGLASYSIYLVHDELIELLHPVLGGAPLPLRAAAVTAIGVAAGIILYRLVELPALALRHRILR